MPWCGPICNAIDDAAGWVEDNLDDLLDPIVDAAEDSIEAFGGWVTDATEWVGEAVTDIAEFIEDAATDAWDWITATIGEWIKEFAEFWEWARGVWGDPWEWISEETSDAWDWIEDAAETVFNTLVTFAEAMAGFLDEIFFPFLLDMLWLTSHIDDLIEAGGIGLLCLLLGLDEEEYDVIEGMFTLDEAAFANRRVAFFPVDDHNYVIFSDLHLFVEGDPLDKFRKMGNHELYQAVLATYQMSGHTLIENGDIEELWMRETTLGGVIMEMFFDALGWPLGSMLEASYEDSLIWDLAFKIFSNNADVYQTIRERFHDTGRYIRLLGNHDDIWRRGAYLVGCLQVEYPELEVFDYVFLGNYGADHHEHGGNRPLVIIAHGHELDAWSNSICKAAGAGVTEAASGIPYLATEVVERSDWVRKLNGLGFDNELSVEYWGLAGIDETEFYEKIMDDFRNQPYVPQFILGHTHHALKAPCIPDENGARFSEYTNVGTAGRWEQFIWCVTIESGTVALHGWTWGSDGNPIKYTFAGDASGYLHAIDE